MMPVGTAFTTRPPSEPEIGAIAATGATVASTQHDHAADTSVNKTGMSSPARGSGGYLPGSGCQPERYDGDGGLDLDKTDSSTYAAGCAVWATSAFALLKLPSESWF